MTRGPISKMPEPESANTISSQMSSIHRPILVNHHSSSLPATPYQHARKLSFGSRSPSPEKVDCQHSPRSARSESLSEARIGVRGPAVVGCKYETGMAHSRRRIPYHIGGDQLEKAKTTPRKFLNPADEEKLSGDMRELYDRILPSAESNARRAKLKEKLELLLNNQWPGNDITVHIFGSSGNLLCTSDSDVDICIITPMKALGQVCLLAKALAEHGMERVICVPNAKVPIVKIWDPELQLACDINVNNPLALENTRMIKTYVLIDERVRPLAMIIKHWTKRRILNDAARKALGGTLSSYTWICMILNFLQTRNPPVLPCLHKRLDQRLRNSEGKLPQFADDVLSLRGLGENNKETLGELLFHFFRLYAHEIDYEKNVLSVREGQLISKEAKGWQFSLNNRLCVEEPFNPERNLGNTADDISFRGLHLELRRAFDLISEAKLEECMKQYEFPAIEEKIWEKPPPRPVPVLRSRSQSQSGRGGKNGFGPRAGKNFSTQNRAQQARRASSAAALNKIVGPQIAARNNIQNQDHALQAHFQQLHLHDRLFNEYQFLQAQEHELRALQQRQAHAQSQLHAQTQAQGSSSSPSGAQSAQGDHSSRSAAINKAPLSAPLRSGSFAYPFAHPLMQGTTQQSVHTNPPSPSMIPAQPEPRRRVHRSSTTDNDPNSNLRSHSQPARLIPVNVLQNMQQVLPMPINANGYIQLYQGRQHQQHLYNTLDINQAQQRPPDHSRRRPMAADMSYDENVPKEYIGYYVHDSPPLRSYREDSIHTRIPNYSNLSYLYRGIPSGGTNRVINPSRSPSPSPAMPLRDRSFSVHSASSAPPAPIAHERARNSSLANRSSGPIIVDGSGGWGSHEMPSATDSSSPSSYSREVVPVVEDQSYEAPLSPTVTRSSARGRHDSFSLENIPPYTHAHSILEKRRSADTTRNSLIEPLMRRTSNQLNEGTAAKAIAKRKDNSTNGNGLGIEYERSIRRQSVDSEKLPQQEPAQQGYPISKCETKSDLPTSRYDYSPKSVPLLSPVREVRTPSPTATRKEDMFYQGPYTGRFRTPIHLEIPSFSSIMNAKHKQTESLAQRSNGRPTNMSESPKTPHQPLTNGWQQPTKKGKKTKSKSQSSQLPILLSGEPLPLNDAERKGG